MTRSILEKFRSRVFVCSFLILCVAFDVELEPDSSENGHTLLDGEDLSRPLLAGDLIIVGGKNAFYILNGTSEPKQVDWHPGNVENCINKGFNEQECQNYVRVLKLDDEGIVTLHGTDATSAKQRTYQISGTGVVNLTKEEPVERATSFFHPQESLFLEINKTVNFAAGFTSIGNPQICKNGDICTPSDPSLFNDPKFLKMNTNDTYVYVLYMDYIKFDDIALNNMGDITLRCQQHKKIKLPHLMRVCINGDDTKSHPSSSLELNTFIKTRLEGSLKNFHYTELVAVSENYNATCNNGKPCTAFAGVFLVELPTEKRYSATVYQFDYEDTDHIFDNGTFVNQTGQEVDNDEVPNPRPGQCQFGIPILAKDYQMLQPIKGRPLLSIDGFNVTAISIDHVMADGNLYQIFYLGTSEGILLRYTIKNDTTETFKEMQKLRGGQTIRYFVWRNKEMEHWQRQLIVSTEKEIVQIQPYLLRNCSIKDVDWLSCMRQQDRQCIWDDEIKSCSSVTNSQEVDSSQQHQGQFTQVSYASSHETIVTESSGISSTSSTVETRMPVRNLTTPGGTESKGEKSGESNKGFPKECSTYWIALVVSLIINFLFTIGTIYCFPKLILSKCTILWKQEQKTCTPA